jgi:prolyl oligopeptidase
MHSILRCTLAASLAATPLLAQTDTPDPNLWLEEISGDRALDQVRSWNKATADILTKAPGFAAYRDRARILVEDDKHIAEPTRIIGDKVLNLWHDAKNPRGLWRISGIDAYAAGRPDWRVLIDIDALGRAESKSWVFKGANCREPAHDRCMVALADGGTDAVVEREFDIASGRFVADGFTLPAAKTSLDWAGPDALYVETDYGPGTLTDSGYGRLVKLWKRGTPLSQATLVIEANKSDVAARAFSYLDGGTRYAFASRSPSYFNTELSHIATDGTLIRSPLPADADLQGVIDGRAIAQLVSAWRGIPAGAVVAYRIADVLAGRDPAFEQVFAPTKSQAVEQVDMGRSTIWIKLLDDVSGKLVALRRNPAGRWTQQPMALPANATVSLEAAADSRDLAFATVEGMLLPPTLYAVSTAAVPRAVQALPARFDASAMEVTQRFANSKDGTRIPYFLVRKKGSRGPVPALVHAYGGFRLAQTPTYLVEQPYRGGPSALFWVEQGNAYVLANIRGGGEYGPAWHAATLREKHQNAFDDLYAVAEDLIRTGVSAPKRIAVSGRSNGGLLAATAITQRPDLFGAAIIGSPLTDMQRYSHLLAGASWMDEYGNPDVPADWAFIAKYSPYQAIKAGAPYPKPFIYTSTKDDRVHPGHARKFAARLEQTGHQFYYAEAIEGGHAAGADRKEDAERAAMIITYLNRELPR